MPSWAYVRLGCHAEAASGPFVTARTLQSVYINVYMLEDLVGD